MHTYIHTNIKTWIQKSATWLAIFAIVLPVNILSAIKVEAASLGDVTITEFMADPDLVIDSNGEWLEVLNTTASSITDFSSWKIGSATISGSATIEPGKSAVVCKNGTVSTNGGVKCDFTSTFSLAQSASTDYQIILKDGGDSTIYTINYNGSDVVSGKSRYANGTNETINQYGIGDYGTPKSNTVAIGNHSYPTIQTAIDGASANDVIDIASGTYSITTVPGITVNKDVTLNGVGSPVITGANKNASTANGSDVLFNVTVSGVTIQNMTIDLGDSDTDYDVAIFTPNSGSINNLAVSNSTLLYATFGNSVGEQLIHLGGGSGANISGNTFDTASGNSGLYVGDGANSSLTINNNTVAPQIASVGGANDTDGGGTFFNQMAPVTNSTISGNSFTDTGIAIYLGSGSSNTDTVTVSNNVFTSNNGNSGGYGALAITSEVDGVNTQNITVTGNTFTSSEIQAAVTIFDSTNTSNANVIGSTITLSSNKFSGNTVAGVSVGSGVSGTITATNNWWGNENGPTHSSNPLGSGDIVSNNVSFSPWWITSTGPSSTIPDVISTELVATNDNTPTFSWTLTGAPTPTETITIDSGTPIALTAGATSYTPTTLIDGTHTWLVTATNSMGSDTSTSDSFVVDTTAPTINSITGTVCTTGDTTMVTVNALDNIAPTSAQISIDGGAYTAMTGTSSPFTYDVVAPAGSTASITYTVKVFDGAGNNTTSPTQTITVTDNDVPTSPVISINSGATFTNQLLSSLTVSASDTIGVTHVRFSESSTLSDALYVPMTSPVGYTLSTGDGTKTVYAQFKDLAGNESAIVSDTIILDQTAPALSVDNPIDRQVFQTVSPTASYGATDSNGIAGYEVSVDGIIIREHISGSTLGTLADGDHTVVVKATDNAGNETSVTRTITINSLLTSEPLTTQFTGIQTDQTINDIANTGIELSGIDTTGDVTFTIGEYASNPTSAGITGLQAFGKYFDVSVSDSTKVTFPMMVKIYYTNADLAGAGITEDKLDGIYFYNTESGAWERYGDSGVQTSDLVADGISFAGYVWANVNHLTPLVAASDTTSPVNPTGVTTHTGDSTLSLSWNAVSSASGYTVRWRPTTATDTGGYTYATTTDTNYTIVGLNNTWSYEVGIASADRHGNMSDFTVVSASPIPAVAAVVQETKSTPAVSLTSTPQTAVVSSAPAQQPVTQETKVITPTQDATPTDDTGSIKGSETQAESGSQAVVVFAILLLALAAGIGGYYGYEWFVQRSTPDGGPVFDAKQKKGSDATPPQQGRGRPKKSDTPRDGRW